MKIYSYLLLSTLLLNVGCNKDSEVSPVLGEPGDVCFKIDGSASMNSLQKSRAEESEIQNADEKKVTSLLAVIFEDKATDENDDKFYKVEQVELGELAEPMTNLSFSVGAEGNFQAAFIANADGALKGKIEALQKGKSTMTDFKTLVSDVMQPDTKPMLMNSKIYAFKSSLTQPTDIGTVFLTRVMARIDIINKVDGMTITKIDFYNRTVKTDLYNDNGLEVKTDYIDENNPKTYNDVNITGSLEEPTKYEAKIYSFEQLANESQTEYLPKLDIFYTKASDVEEPKPLYKHTVELTVNEGGKEPDKLVPVRLKRNNCYRVHLRADNGDIQYEIEVNDWNLFDDLGVGDDELIDGSLGDPADVGNGTNVGDWIQDEGIENIEAGK